VSLWLTDTLHTYCSPAGVWALHRRGLRRDAAAWRHIPAHDEGMTWKPAVAALAAMLPESGCRKLRVTLSSRFVQYRRIPWRDDLKGDKEFETFTRLEFANTFGAHADDWRVVLSDEAPGQSRVAAAVPAGLLSALSELVAANTARLLSAPPALTLAAAAWPPAADSRARCLVAWEADQLCFAVQAAGDWSWIRQRRVGDDWSRELPKLLEEESCLAGIEFDPRSTSLFAPGLSREEDKSLRDAGFALIPQASKALVADAVAATRLLAWCA
jgi:hypothetical protein